MQPSPTTDVFHETGGQLRSIPRPIGVIAGEEATLRIRELAERQHGAVARRQLLSMGMGKGLIQDRVRSGDLVPVHRGVYAVGHRRFDLLHRWMSAVLACGSRAALSHRSAAHLWDLRGWRGPIEISRPSGWSRRAGMVVRQGALRATEVTLEKGIRVTTVEQTLLDVAGLLDSQQLEYVLAAAGRTGRLSWPELERVVAEGEGRVGVGRLRRALRRADPRAEETRSNVEIDFLGLCRDFGLPPPQVNVLIEGRLVDFLWPEARLIVELDTYRYHGDPLAFERDHDSTITLEAAGYRVRRITEQMLGKTRIHISI